jgi:hypothetical protein
MRSREKLCFGFCISTVNKESKVQFDRIVEGSSARSADRANNRKQEHMDGNRKI